MAGIGGGFIEAFNKRLLRQGNRAYTVDFRANRIIYLTDTISGKFLGGAFTKTIAQIHREAALSVQRGMVKELQRRIKDTGRFQGPRDKGKNPHVDHALEISIMHEDNAAITASGFNVLLPAYMNKSPARRYWRQIEQGDPKTRQGHILFTNDFQNWYGPWTEGGSEGRSVSRQQRSGGATKLVSRRKPPGYKHGRMPLTAKGAWVQNIGPWPDYRFSRGGKAALANYPFGEEYRVRLASQGINMTKQFR